MGLETLQISQLHLEGYKQAMKNKTSLDMVPFNVGSISSMPSLSFPLFGDP